MTTVALSATDLSVTDGLLTLIPPPALAGWELLRLHGREAVAHPFHFDLELAPPGPWDLDEVADAALSQKVTFGVFGHDGRPRLFHGVIDSLSQIPGGRLTVEVVPSLLNLALTADCRVFRDKSVPEVVEAVLGEHGVTDVEWHRSREYRRREVVVQYRETALNFVQRLLEEEGIWYYHRHEPGRHILVFGDSQAAYRSGGVIEAAYRPPTSDEWVHAKDAVHSLCRRRDRRPGRYTLNAFHWPTPAANLTVSARSTCPGAGAGEVYDWSEYASDTQGRDYVRLRMEEEETPHRLGQGAGNHRDLAAGSVLRLNGSNYWVLSVEHSAGEAEYRNGFTVLPAEVAYRPARRTPKPSIASVQSATVVGRDGANADSSEVDADQFGRVQVRFAWDRRPGGAVWARVSQQWAGKGFGSWFLPCVGQEVLLMFIDGNPDLPVIVGSVYHAKAGLPFDPSGTCRGWRTRSVRDSDRSHGNEFSFEDAAGHEEVRVCAHRDLDVRVRHDQTTVVENDDFHFVQGSQIDRVGKDRRSLVNGCSAEKTAGDWLLAVGGKAVIDAAGGLIIDAGGCRLRIGPNGFAVELGGNYVVIGSDEVRVNGQLVKLNCAGAAPGIEAANLPAPVVPEPPPRKGGK
jgi:type VI secretion system secreted protein VgrG